MCRSNTPSPSPSPSQSDWLTGWQQCLSELQMFLEQEKGQMGFRMLEACVYDVMQYCHVLRSAVLCNGNTVFYSGGTNLNLFLFADCRGFTHSFQAGL
jgi:hypothetical protein